MVVIKLIKALLIILVFLAAFFPIYINVSAFANPEIQDSIDELRFIGLQIGAVSTDMYMYLGWFSDNKDMLKEASEENIKDLNNIEERLKNVIVPKELNEIKDIQQKLINKLREIYSGVENKDLEATNPEFEVVNEYNTEFSKKTEEVWMQYRRDWQDLPKDFKPIDKDIGLMKTQEDRSAYLDALKLIEARSYRPAYEKLAALKENYKGTIFEDYIMLRISDCLLMYESILKTAPPPVGNEEDGLKILTDLVNSKRYSPLFYEIFYKWRTMEQYYNYGASNMSAIPNNMFNVKRWDVINIIRVYLKDHPDDSWAKLQIDLLLDLSNITRGGDFGNNNMMHWGYLYTDIASMKEEDEEVPNE
ncbi:MAG: hypothetical protein ABIG92_05700 [Candidatus Omnitrophota bacterium]